MIVIIPAQVARSFKLSLRDFHVRFPMYALNRAQMRAIFLRCAKFPQTKSLVWFANSVAFFCTLSKAFIEPSLYGSQHEAPYSRIERTSDM
jgi:hypothetical protein